MLPNPTGPFSVGTMDRVMIDPARTNLYRYTPPTNAFMVSFWYPAEPPVAGAVPGRMWDQQLAADTSFYTTYGNDPRWGQIISSAVGHRFVGVAMADSPGRFPVILYSHGLPTFRKNGSHQAEELASHGYVVVALDHSDCWASEFPDGRYLAGNRNGDLAGRLKDMQFLLNQLVVLDSSDPSFAGRLDLERVGVLGFSFGGEVVETCRTNSTVKCAAIYDATNLQLNSAGLQKPLLVMLGQTTEFFSEDQWLFNKATNNATLLQLRGADHLTGIDWAWVAETPWGRGPTLAVDACLIWFFDTYLKGEAPSFPTNSEIYNVQKK
jgi:dienelactone hydrolase